MSVITSIPSSLNTMQKWLCIYLKLIKIWNSGISYSLFGFLNENIIAFGLPDLFFIVYKNKHKHGNIYITQIRISTNKSLYISLKAKLLKEYCSSILQTGQEPLKMSSLVYFYQTLSVFNKLNDNMPVVAHIAIENGKTILQVS